ncbi:MAG: 23S rRNA (pseudouridine(1915)-N(3))-methyltransferase RlmH [Proteobacteria bacterium]|nr:MAG: 23S rRNA (pseudouridine(1915)-N(3))-methyltransferase RlmH [Pseudomonadota bacterium]
MKINVYSVEKNQDLYVKNLNEEYIKMCLRYANLSDEVVFNKNIAKAQVLGEDEARGSYTKYFLPYLDGFCVSLDSSGEMLDSYEFAKMLKNKSKINFFIGGAYGFEKAFLSKTQRVISLSKLIYAHKIAKLVLFEQIYRGLSILNNHPYHK